MIQFLECGLVAAAVSAAVSYAMRPKQIIRKVRGPYKPKTAESNSPNGRGLEDSELGSASKLQSKEATEEFAVSGPTRVPWRQRRKELEAQHRTKRKQRDEFREIA